MNSQDVYAGKDEDGFASGEVGAVGRNVEEAVALGDGSQIAGPLPAEWRYRGHNGGPRKASGQKMGEPHFFMERFAEMGFEEAEWSGWSSSEHLYGERGEELKGDHRGDGIAGETKDGLPLADGEDSWLARAYGDGVEEEFRVETA